MFLLVFACQDVLAGEAATPLFGYQEIPKTNLDLFPQWLSVLDRHKRELRHEYKCEYEDKRPSCHVRKWLEFLESIKHLPEMEQINKVNEYANQVPYVFDKDNYGMEDYWATPGEFLYRKGDCEDFAIIKMLSLKYLGVNVNRMRVVVLQDTNLRLHHAVMSIESGGENLILDNQINEVISDKYIYHYVPVYSINENRWWMHLPKY